MSPRVHYTHISIYLLFQNISVRHTFSRRVHSLLLQHHPNALELNYVLPLSTIISYRHLVYGLSIKSQATRSAVPPRGGTKYMSCSLH